MREGPTPRWSASRGGSCMAMPAVSQRGSAHSSPRWRAPAGRAALSRQCPDRSGGCRRPRAPHLLKPTAVPHHDRAHGGARAAATSRGRAHPLHARSGAPCGGGARGHRTWMAAQAKVAIAYDSAAWREAGFSGNAFVTHEQAVVGEIYDACGRAAAPPRSPASLPSRRSCGRPSPPAAANAHGQSDGPALRQRAVEGGVQAYQDWAREPFTCSTRDLAAPRRSMWTMVRRCCASLLGGARLHFGGRKPPPEGPAIGGRA